MTQAQALSILKTGSNVFLTGEPGAGKTHTINQYTSYLRDHGLTPAITASTGIAATHIGGMTIHSWSGIGIKKNLTKQDLANISSNQYIVKRIKKSTVLIIEEVSMLLPQTISMVDSVCRKIRQNAAAFGGMQVIFAGDFFQLPPVVKREFSENEQESLIEETYSKFAYESPAWIASDPVICYLTEQHRQDDSNFLNLLTSIRNNSFSDIHLAHIKTRIIENGKTPTNVPKLYSHNADVDFINDEVLAKLPDKIEEFVMWHQGPERIVSALKKGCISPEILYLKKGAAVMFTKNNVKEGYVNGTLGKVWGFNKKTGWPIVTISDDRKIEVEPADWAIEENGRVIAQITQLPLRLAWAITVHKSQGMSLDEAVIDLSDVFEYGQGYVALSRVRRLSGLHILGFNSRAFQVHPEILIKDNLFRAESLNSDLEFSKTPQNILEDLHKDFIMRCGGKFAKSDKNSSSNDTYDESLSLWNAGKSISEIAATRNLKDGTIIDHIEKLVSKGKIDIKDLSRIITPTLKKELPKIREAFGEFADGKLSPVFKKFKGNYSYNDLRIARMLIEQSI